MGYRRSFRSPLYRVYIVDLAIYLVTGLLYRRECFAHAQSKLEHTPSCVLAPDHNHPIRHGCFHIYSLLDRPHRRNSNVMSSRTGFLLHIHSRYFISNLLTKEVGLTHLPISCRSLQGLHWTKLNPYGALHSLCSSSHVTATPPLLPELALRYVVWWCSIGNPSSLKTAHNPPGYLLSQLHACLVDANRLDGEEARRVDSRLPVNGLRGREVLRSAGCKSDRPPKLVMVLT